MTAVTASEIDDDDTSPPLVASAPGQEWREVCADAIRQGGKDAEAVAMLSAGAPDAAAYFAALTHLAARTESLLTVLDMRGVDVEGVQECKAALGNLRDRVAGSQVGMLDIDREMLANGFARIGRMDSTGRRSLWVRFERVAFTDDISEPIRAIELRAGREDDDAYCRITRDDLGSMPSDIARFRELYDVFSTAKIAAEWEDGGLRRLHPVRDHHPVISASTEVLRRWRESHRSTNETINLAMDRLYIEVMKYAQGDGET